MQRLTGLILASAMWLTLSACDRPPGPAAEGLPQNEGQGVSPRQQQFAEEEDRQNGAQSNDADPGQVTPTPPTPPPPQPPAN